MTNTLVELDKDIEDLIPAFFNSRRQDLQRLEVLLSERDWRQIDREGHKIKGGSGSFGFKRLSQLAAELQAAAARQDLDATRNCLAAMRSHLDQVQIRYV